LFYDFNDTAFAVNGHIGALICPPFQEVPTGKPVAINHGKP